MLIDPNAVVTVVGLMCSAVRGSAKWLCSWMSCSAIFALYVQRGVYGCEMVWQVWNMSDDR
jgi:hypothetical protein